MDGETEEEEEHEEPHLPAAASMVVPMPHMLVLWGALTVISSLNFSSSFLTLYLLVAAASAAGRPAQLRVVHPLRL